MPRVLQFETERELCPAVYGRSFCFWQQHNKKRTGYLVWGENELHVKKIFKSLHTSILWGQRATIFASFPFMFHLKFTRQIDILFCRWLKSLRSPTVAKHKAPCIMRSRKGFLPPQSPSIMTNSAQSFTLNVSKGADCNRFLSPRITPCIRGSNDHRWPWWWNALWPLTSGHTRGLILRRASGAEQWPVARVTSGEEMAFSV